jgi:hypothetical protein
METVKSIVKTVDDVLGGPFYRRFDRSIVVSNAVVGLCLVLFGMGARVRTPYWTLSQGEFMASVIVGASLMCLSAVARVYRQHLAIEKIKALSKSIGGGDPE